MGGGQSFSALSDNPVSWTVSLSPGWQSVSCPAGSLSLISILTLHLFTDLAVLPAYCCIVDNFCGWVRVSSLSDLRWPLCHSLQRLPSWPSFSRTSLGSEALIEVDTVHHWKVMYYRVPVWGGHNGQTIRSDGKFYRCGASLCVSSISLNGPLSQITGYSWFPPTLFDWFW